MCLVPEHGIIAVKNNRILNGHHMCKKVYCIFFCMHMKVMATPVTFTFHA